MTTETRVAVAPATVTAPTTAPVTAPPPHVVTAGRAAPADAPPPTRDRLARRFAALGVRPGGVLLVQASLRALGPVDGGAATVTDALLDALGGPSHGTLVAYTATPENSSTSRLHLAAVAGLTEAEAAAHRARMPRFDPATTPCSPTVGALSEEIRTRPGARRSAHPQTSFAALGARAEEIVRRHDLTSHLGPDSPLGRLYELDARVLMMGVPMSRFTAFHLADLRMPGVRLREYRCSGPDGWVTFTAPDLDDLHFAELGAEVLSRAAGLTERRIGGADCRLVPVREAVDLAVEALRELRGR
ncbi:aminoglycoside N(3)-acetyltransferase [Kitasatospora sp. NPDC058406]|uniref:aminoglycoside N(3)-acetyltransferase n=1 Tax=Streptomycetaceae TaxID=2062 RepID=UPI002E765C4D|nr:AAC(3) family N-acetyltransferase [Streptomyces sp. BE303]MED7955386.1 AAC(3) family N-acetyltransferase [Streptomyces sp. BE303]